MRSLFRLPPPVRTIPLSATSCCNATKGIYYYTTYDNHQISAVDMHKTDLNGQELARFTPVTTEQIHFMN